MTGRAELSTQTHHVTILYDREAEDGTLNRISQSLTLRWTGRYEMELLLKSTGWTLERLYGSYALVLNAMLNYDHLDLGHALPAAQAPPSSQPIVNPTDRQQQPTKPME